jgi:hypothetical protein
MAKAAGRDPVLARISLVIPGRAIALGGEPQEGPACRLDTEAMRWTYVLRTRERWLGSREASASREEQATRTLKGFGLKDADIEALAGAARIVVRMPYQAESDGWQGRVFPWEYVLAKATRRYRNVDNHHFTVMREVVPAASATWRKSGQPCLLYVQSAPGGLRRGWDFSAEARRLRRVLGGIRLIELKDPSWQQLHDVVKLHRPDLIHLSGFDNLSGLKALRDQVPDGEAVEAEFGPMRLGDVLARESSVPDGMLLAGEAGGVAVIGAQRLAEALSAGGAHCAYFVAASIGNSAARTAALIVAERAALSAVGFQDAVENQLADFFFELVYSQLNQAVWNLPLAFESAWLRARQEPKATRASGVTLWMGAPLNEAAFKRGEPAAAELRDADTPPRLLARPEQELNYAVLHNNGRLFSEIVVERGSAAPDDWLSVDVELQLGPEQAHFRKRFLADKTRFDLSDQVHVPLTAALMRSLQEAVNSTLMVQLSHNDRVLARDSHRLRLLPVDQWRDNEKDGQWLPSFVLPRDPAVVGAVELAQRYVRVLRDNPAAGFEGYQAAPGTQEEQLREVDLQVQAIWSALLHEWRLGYVNPPPAYSSKLDSQRLRTPSTILGARSGTCIDLALLFAACLELIDVYPVIFLLNGHALPGYWRHHSFQADYLAVSNEGAQGAMAAADRNSSGSLQRFAWQAIGDAPYREVRQLIRARRLVPIETVRLTEHCGFVEAVEAGIDALAEADDFHSVLDIVTARMNGITPLPIVEGQP